MPMSAGVVLLRLKSLGLAALRPCRFESGPGHDHYLLNEFLLAKKTAHSSHLLLDLVEKGVYPTRLEEV